MNNSFPFSDVYNITLGEPCEMDFDIFCSRVNTESVPVKSYHYVKTITGYDRVVDYLKYALAENLPIEVRQSDDALFMVFVG